MSEVRFRLPKSAQSDSRYPPGYRLKPGPCVAVQLAPPLSMAVKVWKRKEDDAQRYLLIDQNGDSTGFTVTLEDVITLRALVPQA